MASDLPPPDAMAEASIPPARLGIRRASFLLPGLVFAGIAVALGIGLTLKPQEIPSALIGRPAPTFSLPPVQGRTLGLASSDLKGHVSLVNVFASWCAACRAEHPLLLRLAKEGPVPIYGIDYKDKPDDGAHWLDTMGDPYARTGADIDGRVSIEWGVYRVPETYVVDRDGRIAFRQIGPITPEDLDGKILPLIKSLRR